MSPVTAGPTGIPALTRALLRGCFVEAAYFGTLSALRTPTAEAHLLAGAACCGCIHPLAVAQRLFEGEPMAEHSPAVHSPAVHSPGEHSPAEHFMQAPSLRIAPVSELPYEGFFHLIEALRRDPAIRASRELAVVLNSIADDLVFVSRRELERPPDSGKRYTLSAACLAAAVLLTRLTASPHQLARVPPYKLDHAAEMIEAEFTGVGGDAAFYP